MNKKRSAYVTCEYVGGVGGVGGYGCVWVCGSMGFDREKSDDTGVRLDYYRAYGTPGPKIKLAHVHGMYAMQSLLKQSCVYSIAAILIIVLQMFYLSIEPSLWGGISTGNLLKAGKSIWDGLLCHILLHLGLQIMMIRLAHWEKNIFCGNNVYCFSNLCNERAPSQVRDYSDTSQGFFKHRELWGEIDRGYTAWQKGFIC